jgi:hypothetical protein
MDENSSCGDPPAPKKKSKRRWLQYSLRSLFFFTLICAIGTAWVVDRIQQKRNEREAVEAIVKLGGHAYYDYQRETPGQLSGPGWQISGPVWLIRAEPPGPAWLRKLLGENFFSEVDAVLLYETNANNADLANLSEFASLQWLDLSKTNITDAGPESLTALSKLQTLHLWKSKATYAGAKVLQRALPNCQIYPLTLPSNGAAALENQE